MIAWFRKLRIHILYAVSWRFPDMTRNGSKHQPLLVRLVTRTKNDVKITRTLYVQLCSNGSSSCDLCCKLYRSSVSLHGYGD